MATLRSSTMRKGAWKEGSAVGDGGLVVVVVGMTPVVEAAVAEEPGRPEGKGGSDDGTTMTGANGAAVVTALREGSCISIDAADHAGPAAVD